MDELTTRKKPFTAISVKIMVPIGILIAFFIMLSTVGLYKLQDSYFRAQAQKQAHLVSNVVITNLERAMHEGKSEEIQRNAEALTRNGDIKAIRVANSDWIVAVSTVENEKGNKFDKEIEPCASCHYRGAKMSDSIVRKLADGSEVLTFAHAIKNREACYGCHDSSKSALGILLLDISMSESAAVAKQARIRLLGTEFITLVLALIVIWFIVFRVVNKPVRRLVDGVRRIGDGDLDYRVDLKGNDEIVSLGRSFNDMADNLQEQMREMARRAKRIEKLEKLKLEIEESNKALDAKVSTMSTLNEIVGELSVNRNFDETLNKILNVAVEKMGVSDLVLYVKDENDNTLRVRAATAISSTIWRDLAFRVGEGMTGMVAHTGKARIIDDVKKYPDFKYYHGSRKDIGSFISVPLKIRGKIIGVMNVNDKNTNAFSEESLAIFTTIAGQIAVALDNASHHENAMGMAEKDALTSLYNYGAFHVKLKEKINDARSTSKPLALLILDIDSFNKVNEKFGYAAGDELLKKAGEMISEACGGAFIGARYGGDEFAIIMPDTTERDASIFATRLLMGIKRITVQHGVSSEPFMVTASAGIAAFKSSMSEKELKSKAMAMAKRAGEIGGNSVLAAKEPSVA